MATNPPQLERRADIDGLRALAIIPVVLFHARFPGFEAGYVGVDIFYVISGYLITRIISNEVESSGRFRFGNFYARRARRLLPAALLVITATAAAVTLRFPPMERSAVLSSGLWSLAYLSNVHFWLLQTNYFDSGDFLDPYLHTWSLSIEEQFYLFWPLLILFAHRVRSIRAALVLVMIGVLVVSLGACVVESYRVTPTAFFLLPFRAWEFAAGALAGSVPRLGKRAALASGAAGLAAICASLFLIPADVIFPGIAATVPVIGTAALLASGDRDQMIARALRHPAMRYVGGVSYSWYLWHWPVLIIGEDLFAGGGTLVARMSLAALSFAMAAATFSWVEKPLRQSRFLGRSPAHTFMPIGAASLLCVMVLVGMLGLSRSQLSTPPYRAFAHAAKDGPRVGACITKFTKSVPKLCSFGHGQRVIVLFGDSHAAMWFPAAEEAANKRGFRLVTLLKSACPAADVTVFNPKIGRVETECRAWRMNAIERIRQLDPAAIILASAKSYVSGPGRTGGYAINSPRDWSEGYRRTLSELPRGARILLIQDVPRFPLQVPFCLEHQAWVGRGDCSASRAVAIDERVNRAEVLAAAGMPNVEILNFTSDLCDSARCGPVLHNIVAYRDNNHLARSFVTTLSDRFCKMLPPARPGIGGQSAQACTP